MLKTKFNIPETSRLVNNISHWIKSAIVSLPRSSHLGLKLSMYQTAKKELG